MDKEFVVGQKLHAQELNDIVTEINGKAAASHTHEMSDVNGLNSAIANRPVTEYGKFSSHAWDAGEQYTFIGRWQTHNYFCTITGYMKLVPTNLYCFYSLPKGCTFYFATTSVTNKGNLVKITSEVKNMYSVIKIQRCDNVAFESGEETAIICTYRWKNDDLD